MCYDIMGPGYYHIIHQLSFYPRGLKTLTRVYINYIAGGQLVIHSNHRVDILWLSLNDIRAQRRTAADCDYCVHH